MNEQSTYTDLAFSKDGKRFCLYSSAPVSFAVRNTMLNRMYVEISVYLDAKKVKKLPFTPESGILTTSFYLYGDNIYEIYNQEVVRVAIGSSCCRCDNWGTRIQLFWRDKADARDFIACELSNGRKIKLTPNGSLIRTARNIWEWYLQGLEDFKNIIYLGDECEI